MKLKIKITGSKVHDVGYRPYLTELAMRLALRGFEVYNDDEEGQQIVIALVEGDEQRTTKFYNSATNERPQLASVDDVLSEDFAGDIMPLWQFASINTASQMNKAIPLLIAVKDNTDATLEEIKAVRKTTDTTLEEIKAVRKTTDATLDEIRAVRKNTDAIPQVLEEVKGLREDIQPGYAMNFRQVQADVRAIKDRLGML
jgi:acylphosphatase